jgi:hypothetical protein
VTEAADEAAARAIVDCVTGELLANPLIEQYDVELLGGASSVTTTSSEPTAASAAASSSADRAGA